MTERPCAGPAVTKRPRPNIKKARWLANHLFYYAARSNWDSISDCIKSLISEIESLRTELAQKKVQP